MENGPERLAIIREAVDVLREDAPVIFTRHPIGYGLYHEWYTNVYPAGLDGSTMKYVRIDAAKREEYRSTHNRPVVWPVILLLAVAIGVAVPAIRWAAAHLREI